VLIGVESVVAFFVSFVPLCSEKHLAYLAKKISAASANSAVKNSQKQHQKPLTFPKNSKKTRKFTKIS